MYIFTNDIQSKNSSIACIVPSILSIIYANLDRMVLNDSHQSEFRDNLIFFIKKKFDYELNSKVYLVAAFLNVETLSAWRDRSYSQLYYKNAFENLFDVIKTFENNQKSAASTATTIVEKNKTDKNYLNNASRQDGLTMLTSLLRSKSSQELQNPDHEKIKDEILKFSKLITEIKIESTKKFWQENKNKFPNLYLLALRLLSILAASSSIETFFSVSGIVSNESYAKMDDKLLIKKSLLRVNINLVEKFK